MEIYQTSAGLEYRQLLYLIKLEQIKDYSYKYLIIGGVNMYKTDEYALGDTICLYDYEVENSSFKIEHSSLNGTYLFDHFLENYLTD